MRFEDKIRCLGLLFRFSVTSWIRALGDGSLRCENGYRQHLLGLAVDIELKDVHDAVSFIGYARGFDLNVNCYKGYFHVEEPPG